MLMKHTFRSREPDSNLIGSNPVLKRGVQLIEPQHKIVSEELTCARRKYVYC